MNWMFGMTGTFFVLGVLWPLFTVKKHAKFWIFTLVNESNTVSLVSGLRDMATHGEMALFAIILLFSVVFPLVKITLCGMIWYWGVSMRLEAIWVHWLAVVGKWSMLDVLVVSLLVVALKLGDLVEVEIHKGVYFFAASVIMSMILTTRISRCLPR